MDEDVVLSRPGFTLPSTVSLPAGDGTVPCIVFFAGSGPTDRDWTSPLLPGRNGSGAQLALALQTRGVGSIRFDKVGSGVNMPKSAEPADLKMLDVLSLAHYVDEAVAAFDELANRDQCGRIFLLGHSEGSIHASSAAIAKQADPRFGGLISLSGPSRSLLDTAIEQMRAMPIKAGADAAVVDNALEDFRAAMQRPDAPAPDLSALPEVAGVLWQATHAPQQLRVARELMLADPTRSAARLPRSRPRGLGRQRRPGARIRCGQDLRGPGERRGRQDAGDGRQREPRLQVRDPDAIDDQPGRAPRQLRGRRPRPRGRSRRRDRGLRHGELVARPSVPDLDVVRPGRRKRSRATTRTPQPAPGRARPGCRCPGSRPGHGGPTPGPPILSTPGSRAPCSRASPGATLRLHSSGTPP